MSTLSQHNTDCHLLSDITNRKNFSKYHKCPVSVQKTETSSRYETFIEK